MGMWKEFRRLEKEAYEATRITRQKEHDVEGLADDYEIYEEEVLLARAFAERESAAVVEAALAQAVAETASPLKANAEAEAAAKAAKEKAEAEAAAKAAKAKAEAEAAA